MIGLIVLAAGEKTGRLPKGGSGKEKMTGAYILFKKNDINDEKKRKYT